MRTILLGLLLTLLAACGAAEPTKTPPVNPAAGPLGSWRLITLAGQPALGTRVTLVLDANGQASGNGGCNQFSSAVTLTDATISFASITSTMMACVDDSMNTQETAYLSALQSAATWALDGDSLTLRDAQDTAVAVFTRQ